MMGQTKRPVMAAVFPYSTHPTGILGNIQSQRSAISHIFTCANLQIFQQERARWLFLLQQRAR
jgi:hypothetical protein